MWLPDTPRTTVQGYRHRLITRGPPVRVGLHRLSRPETERVEQALQEDVDRGQLVKGHSLWGFPAFMTKDAAAYKGIKRKPRLVVDYRELNRVTVRKFFIIPNSEGIKATVAGSRYISVGDLKEGFNQVLNELEASKKMAVLSVSGTWLPKGLTFGPVNGPEDFQGLVFEIFRRRLYKDHFLFLDDLAVATGRKACLPPGPSGVRGRTRKDRPAIGPSTLSRRSRRPPRGLLTARTSRGVAAEAPTGPCTSPTAPRRRRPRSRRR